MTSTLPPNLDRNRRLDRWIEVNADGTVEVRTGKVEVGQGITSALAQIAAEELDVAYARIRMIAADTGRSPNEGVTAGSKSIEDSGGALRMVGAEVRAIFLRAAAERLGASVDELKVEDGTIRLPGSNRSTSYWELAGEVDLSGDATGSAAPKRADQLTLVGKPMPRLDLPAKVTGAAYVHDLDCPGMLYGRVLRPPSYRARLLSFDARKAEAMPGVRAVVRHGRFIGVVTEREEQAIAAVTVLARCATWSEAEDLPDVDAMPAFLQAQPAETVVLSDKSTAPPNTGPLVRATYSRPFLAHGSIGPSCAVARCQGDTVEVWSHSQSIHPLRRDIAMTLGRDPASVTVHHVDGAGCYGHNGADDAALDAVLLAAAVEGAAVKLQWSREDEFGWEPFGPAMTVAMAGAVDAQGRITAWQHELWSNPHIARPGLQKSPSLLAAWHLDRGFEQPNGVDSLAGGEGASQRNAVPLYTFANERVVHHVLGRLPVRTSTLRSIGSFANIFAIECFLDELAHSAGLDPIDLRLRHLEDARARDVITAAAERSGLRARRGKGAGTRGIGLAFGRYTNKSGYAAVVAEVEIEEAVRVVRVVTAVDCGRVINPDGVANQAEGGIVQAISWTLKEQVRFDRTRITTRNWDDYPILRFSEAPPVETIVIDRPDEPSIGMGEVMAGPTAAAIANALFDATQVRVRDLPLTRERVLAAMQDG